MRKVHFILDPVASSSIKIQIHFINRQITIPNLCLTTVSLKELKEFVKKEMKFSEKIDIALTTKKYDRNNILQKDDASLEYNDIRNNMILYIIPIPIPIPKYSDLL